MQFKAVLKEISALYQTIKEYIWQGDKIHFKFKETTVAHFQYLCNLLAALFKIKPLNRFKTCLEAILAKLTHCGTRYSEKLRAELITRLPRTGLTERNLKYYRKKVKGAFSLILRQFRGELEAAKQEFKKGKFLLLKRPEKLSTYESEFLTNYLKNYPEFCKYRNLSLRISNIYHDPPEKLTPSIIADIELWEDAHPDLQHAITTLKKNIDKIFNFVQLDSAKKYKNYGKISRVTPEPQMRKIKDLYRTKFGFRTVETTRLLLENQLACPMVVSCV